MWHDTKQCLKPFSVNASDSMEHGLCEIKSRLHYGSTVISIYVALIVYMYYIFIFKPQPMERHSKYLV